MRHNCPRLVAVGLWPLLTASFAACGSSGTLRADGGATGGMTGSGGEISSGDAGTTGSGGTTGNAGTTGKSGNAGTTGSGNAGTTGSAGATGTAIRPSYNKGVGFFVLNGKLYDANGNEFRIRGVDKLHFDWDPGSTGIANSKANTVRWNIDFTRSAATNVALLQGGAGQTSGTIYNHIAVMPGMWDVPAGTLTCSNDTSLLSAGVAIWVAQAATWTQIEKYSILNIANEWGPSSSTVWRDSYISAIAKMRAAGYHATLSITSGGCGQDNGDLVKYAQAVFNSDPEKNVIFDRHVYGGDPDVATLNTDAAALAALGLPIIFGEFGPGMNIGPTPTLLTPASVIQTAEKNGFGWMAWAWDDTNVANQTGDNTFFALSYKGSYGSSADLTIYGQQVVEGCTNPAPGGCGCPDSPMPALTVVAPGCKGTPAPAYSTSALKTLAKPATIF